MRVFLCPILTFGRLKGFWHQFWFYIFTKAIHAKPKHMKNTGILIFCLIMTLSGCSSQKKLQAEAPFAVEGASCQEYAAGREESGTGFLLKLPVELEEQDSISFDKVYFRGHILSTTLKEDNGDFSLEYDYNTTTEHKKEIEMHADATKEVGNQPPKLKTSEELNFPFELNADEAVVAYTEAKSKKVKYIKISGIKDMPVQNFRSRPQN
jgi:hypothetical protein